MSAARRKKPTKPDPKQEPVDEVEELDTLEPLDSLEPIDSLEPLDSPTEDAASPVGIAIVKSDEARFDTVFELVVPELEKKAMPDAVGNPLRKTVTKERGSVRHKKVLVRFSGDTIIGSAVRDRVGEILREAKVLHGVVRRGFGDETVCQGELPKAEVTVRTEGNAQHVEVGGELAAEDLGTALAPELEKLAAVARGKTVTFSFGTLAADAPLREQLRTTFANAGASRLVLGTDVIFDKDLESVVRVARGKDGFEITVLGDDESKAAAALAFVLRPAEFSKQRVRIKATGKALSAAALAKLVTTLAQSKPEQILLDRGAEPADLLWPRLFEIGTGEGRMVLRVHEGGRNRAGLVLAFRRETSALGTKLAGSHVTIDWPAGFVLDTETEKACITDALGSLQPASISCSFGGADKEPFHPDPVRFTAGKSGGRVAHLDTDSAKPVELVKAIERRFRRAKSELEGQHLLVAITGSASSPRSLLRTILAEALSAKVSGLAIDDHGTVDVLVPDLLKIAIDGQTVRVSADPTGRDVAQIEVAIQREFDAAGVQPGSVFELTPSGATHQLVAAAIARQASRVVLAGKEPVQVHPALFAGPERIGQNLVLRAEPGPDAAVVTAQVRHELPALLEQSSLAGASVTLIWPGADDPASEPLASALSTILAGKPQSLVLDDGSGYTDQIFPEVARDYVTELGRRDSGTPPMLMLGVDVVSGKRHFAALRGKLGSLSEALSGRRVLLVLRSNGNDAPAGRKDAVIAAAREIVDPVAAATLVFRGSDAQGRAFFEVVHSVIEGLAVGTKARDPRPKA